ncbi:MAG: hypothetical protein FWE28_02255 [Oscillospiraceae bacterium]|nr:hypothetical protein [Oscillospiraceae bacterium]
MRKKIIVLSIATLILGGLFAGCSEDMPTQNEERPQETSNAASENTQVPDETQEPDEAQEQNEATSSTATAPSEQDQISGVVEEIQEREIRISLIASESLNGQEEMARILQASQTILVDENTVFERAIVEHGVLVRTETASFADIYLQDSIQVFGQEQEGVFLAEKITIYVFEW